MNTLHRNLSRRALLRSLGVGAAAVPLLPELGRADGAAQSGFPTRLVIVTFPNGVFHSAFWPGSSNGVLKIDDGPMSSLAPLKAFEDKLLVVGGLSYRNMQDAKAAWAHSSTPFVLTAAPGADFEGAWDGMKKTGGAPSIDLHVAAGLAAQGVRTQLPSLVLRTGTYNGNDGYLSIAGPPMDNKVNAPAPETDPVRLFQKLFGASSGTAAAREAEAKKRAVDRSVLNYVAKSLPKLKSRVGLAHGHRIEAHLQAVHELDMRLQLQPQSCPEVVAPTSPTGETRFLGHIQRQFSDLAVAALRCDLTRVVNVGWIGANYQFEFPTAGEARILDESTTGPYQDDHGTAHAVSAGPEAVRKKVMIDRWFMREFAHLLTLMNEVKEGDGTLLDHSIVVLTNQMADGYWHSATDVPYVIAGGGNGAVTTKRLVRWTAGSTSKTTKPHSGLLEDLSVAMGVPPEGLKAGPYAGAFGVLKG